MTMTAFPLFSWPQTMVVNLAAQGSIGVGNSTMTFDSTTDRVAFLTSCPFTDTLTDVYFRVGAVTSAPNVDVRLETVSNGRPTGTLIGTNTNKVITIGSSNTWQTATLTAGASLTAGMLFAVVVVYSSGTANFAMNTTATNIGLDTGNWPIILQDTGTGTWTLRSNLPVMFFKFSGGVKHIPGAMPVDTGTSVGTFNSGSSPDEYALTFQVPVKMRAAGIQFNCFPIAAGADFTCSIWPASSTVDGDALAQVAIDGDTVGAASGDTQLTYYFPTPVTLSTGTTYYAGVRADTANNVDIIDLRSPSGIANSMNAFPIPSGGTLFKASRTWTAGSAGAWTTTQVNSLPLISLMVDQLDDGASTGGGLMGNPPLHGGMQG